MMEHKTKNLQDELRVGRNRRAEHDLVQLRDRGLHLSRDHVGKRRAVATSTEQQANEFSGDKKTAQRGETIHLSGEGNVGWNFCRPMSSNAHW